MSREITERRSFRNALETYLAGAGWTNLVYTEGWDNDVTIENPQVNVYFVTKKNEELEIGRVTAQRIFDRLIQVDCYMESEDRASAISDDVMDFMDLVPISITDFQSNYLGSLICFDTTGIETNTQPPLLNDPRVLRWRAIIRGPFVAQYLNG